MEENRRRDFKYWLKNVFWYHYGKLAIAGVIALAVVIWLTVDATKKVEYDLNVAIVSEDGIAQSDTKALGELLGAAAGDVNGDGKTNVNIMTVNLGDMQNLEAVQYQMLLYLSLPEYTIFLMDDRYSAIYGQKDETFQPLADYGIETADELPTRIDLSEKAVLKALGEREYFASLSDWTVDGKGSREMTDAAVRALKALIDSPDAE